MLEPYDHNNCFNIWSNNLKLRKKNLDLEKSLKDTMKRMGSSSGKDEETLARELQTIDKETKDMVKGVQFKIRRLHIRYEDDYYSADKPYSFGLVFDEVNFESSEMKQIFERLADMTAKEAGISSFN
jgi:hypothetical protein